MEYNGDFRTIPLTEEVTGGLRKGELMALLWEDLDVEHRILSVSKQPVCVNGKLEITEPKTANFIRKVVLPQHTVELLSGVDRELADENMNTPRRCREHLRGVDLVIAILFSIGNSGFSSWASGRNSS